MKHTQGQGSVMFGKKTKNNSSSSSTVHHTVHGRQQRRTGGRNTDKEIKARRQKKRTRECTPSQETLFRTSSVGVPDIHGEPISSQFTGT